MTPDEFNTWVKDMLKAKKAKSVAHISRLLGTDRKTIYNLMAKGGSRRDMLACMALLYGLRNGE